MGSRFGSSVWESAWRSVWAPPLNEALVALLALAGAYAIITGSRRISRGLDAGAALEVIRGIRVCIFALVAGLFAIGLAFGHTGFVVFGAIILAEELYETGALAAIIRLGDRPA